MTQTKRTTLLGVSLVLLWAHHQAQAQSRTDEIESARTAKEANLTPESQPRVEQDIERVENSFAYRLFTGQLGGFGLGTGTIVPGSSVAFGPRFQKRFWDGKLLLRLEARGSINQSYLGRMELGLSHLWNDRAFVTFTSQHRDISEMPYYGPGPNSRKTGRSDYRLEDTSVELHPGVHIFKGLTASAIGSYLADNVGPGHSTRYISTEQQFGPDSAPGIDRQTDFWRGGGQVEFDWRDDPSRPTSGGKYSADYLRYVDQSLSAFSFYRVDLDAVQYIPLLNHTRVIALHAASSLTDTQKGQQVPFYLQPILGGPDTLRGFRYGRFYGNNSVLVSGEYRWFCSPVLDMAIFADGGKVFDQWEQWNFHHLQSDVGFSLRFKGRTGRTVFSFDSGFSHEGYQLWVHVNNLI
jgi:outer membrane protein assembly factor BamA